MELDALRPTTSANTVPTADEKSAKITSDFDTFLKMLTVQLQNQDPLNPIESSDYAVQLATFSGVEQQVQTNDLLRDLASRMSADGLAQLSSWVGMEARTAEPVPFQGSPIALDITPDPTADRVELVVYDGTDSEVQRIEVAPGQNAIDWTGMATGGSSLPIGTYRFDVVSYALGEEIARSPAMTYARVTEVQSAGGINQLVLETGKTVPTTSVTAIREPGVDNAQL